MLLLFGSANRDETVFEDADEFHLERRDGRHVAFGIGPHRCVGSHLARLEMRIAIEEFLRRVPDFRLAPAPTPAGTPPGRWTGVRGERAAHEGRGRSLDVRRARAVLGDLPDGLLERRARLRRRAGDGTVPREDEEDAQLAIDSCPEQAIAIVDD